MITITDLTFWYSKKSPLFEHLDQTLSPGHIYGLLGKNGAGKTTLLKLICGLTFPMEGTILAGENTPGDRKPRYLQELFFLPEEVYLPAGSPAKLLNLYAGFYPAFSEAGFRSMVKQFEVDYDQKLAKLSFGQKKKVMIAFALACNTRYLFLDEPTNGLDIPSKATFRSMLAGAFNEDRIILISTHQVRDLQSLIDHVLILNQGRIIISQPVEDGAPGRVDLETLFNSAISSANQAIPLCS